MTNNIGPADRVVRLTIAGVIAFMLALGLFTGWFAWLVGAIAAYLGATAAVGHCPLYEHEHIDSHSHDGTEHFGG